MIISPPERGQPIDLSYMSEMAKAINDLSTKVSGKTAISVVANGINLPESATTGNLRFYAATQTIQAANVSVGDTANWSVEFAPSFLYVPVVTATVQNKTASKAGDNINLVIKNEITTGKVSGIVRYNTAGSIDIIINVIAIGISKWYNSPKVYKCWNVKNVKEKFLLIEFIAHMITLKFFV